ncbi:MAG: NFACT family protein [Bacilli bacterium]|nr:NFACT family protein [Bacilli bacterium]
MPVDGVFLHFMVQELNNQILGDRIQKFACFNATDYLLTLSSRKRLLISLDVNHPHVRLTQYETMGQTHGLSSFLKKHVEGSIIRAITQQGADRILTITLEKRDELGYTHSLYMVLELTGRSSNMIFVDENQFILESVKRSFITDERLIAPRAPYTVIHSLQHNPFTQEVIQYPLEGVSRPLLSEIEIQGNLRFLQEAKVNPVLIEWEGGSCFHAFDLPSFAGRRTYYPTLSALCEAFFSIEKQSSQTLNDEKRLQHTIQKELKKCELKLSRQIQEWEEAKANLHLEQTANVLASNLHLVQKYQDSITVLNFYTQEDITIPLDPHKTASENITALFNKYKKAKRTIDALSATMEETKTRIHYLETLLQQTNAASLHDLKEIKQEIEPKKGPAGRTKPAILTYQDEDGNRYMIGKNNTQNNYVTHTLANANDYFFHVAQYPGSHCIFRGELTEDAIHLASTLAAIYSKAKGKVAVDYTLVKYVKKVKGQPGSFVTYTHQKQTQATPNPTITQHLTVISS